MLARHKALKLEWRTLCGHALGKANVFDEPTLKTCQDVRAAGARGNSEPDPDLRGDVAAHNFWKAGCCAVFDVRVTDTDAPSQRGMDPMSCLARHEKDKKKRYPDPLTFFPPTSKSLRPDTSASMPSFCRLLIRIWLLALRASRGASPP